jgi:hypothetical protein
MPLKGGRFSTQEMESAKTGVKRFPLAFRGESIPYIFMVISLAERGKL